PSGTLLQITDTSGGRRFHYCRGVEQRRDPFGPTSRWRLVLDGPFPFAPQRADIIRIRITVRDGAGNVEAFDGLALGADHPRCLASVLCDESTLLWPDPSWAGTDLLPASDAVELVRSAHEPFAGGVDAYGDLVAEDFFDPEWTPADDSPGAGITALSGLADLTHLVVPDLYMPKEWAGDDVAVETQVDEAGAEF